jgi:centrosomal protein CEP104
VHNEGDNDLEPFLKPLLAQAGGNVQALEMESLRRAYSDGTLTVAGVRLWNAVHSETWRHREASCEAFYQFLTNPKGLPPKYSKKTLDLFTATTEIAAIACRDKLLQIYFLGLKLLEEALSPKICGGDVPAKTVDRAIRPFVRLLIDKVGEMNYRARDISLNTLRMLFRHPAVELRHAIEGIMDITERPPGPAKAQWRLVSARLEILHQLVREFGVNDRVWNWQIVY